MMGNLAKNRTNLRADYPDDHTCIASSHMWFSLFTNSELCSLAELCRLAELCSLARIGNAFNDKCDVMLYFSHGCRAPINSISWDLFRKQFIWLHDRKENGPNSRISPLTFLKSSYSQIHSKYSLSKFNTDNKPDIPMHTHMHPNFYLKIFNMYYYTNKNVSFKI